MGDEWKKPVFKDNDTLPGFLSYHVNEIIVTKLSQTAQEKIEAGFLFAVHLFQRSSDSPSCSLH
jgi:hypothetical protein